MNRSETIGKVMDALRQAQLEFDPVLKDTRNPLYNSKYAELSGVIAATQPALAKNGLVISQLAISDLEHQGSGVTTLLVHTSGEFIASDFLLPAAGRGKGDVPRYDAQTACAAITYARRYTYLAIIGVAAEDDDGNQASGQRAPSQSLPEEMPDFQEAQRGAPKPPAAPKTKKTTETTKPSPKASQEAPAAAAGASQTAGPSPTTSSALPATGPSTPAQASAGATASASPEHGDAYEGPDKDRLPTEEELTTYRQNFTKLADSLTTEGKLKASKGLPVNRKLLVFLISITKATDAKNITQKQWTDFFQRVEAAKTNPEVGLAGITKLVNKANGIDDKKA